jgi:trk system potassium uptake protein TrkH
MRTIFFTYGLCLIGLSFFMFFPMLADVSSPTHEWNVFALSQFFCFFLGGLMVFSSRSGHYTLRIRDAYLLTVTVWVGLSLFSALPFYFTAAKEYRLNFTDAVFEAVSGLTTTGSTVYTHLDAAPHGILLWRSILQWIGGIGIVVFSMTILPYLRVGGMQLFRSESSDNSDKILPHVHLIAGATLAVYTGLSLLIVFAYDLAGMSLFDAVNHAMTTISTGGFSTHDASFGYFKAPLMQWLGTLFMIAGGTPMMLYISLFVGRKNNSLLLYQAKAFWIGLTVVSLGLALWLWYTHTGWSFADALRQCAFNVTSVVTTTGFATTDYTLWGGLSVMAFYFLTIAGGCTGSTSGGIKIFRFQIVGKALMLELRRLISPHGVFPRDMGGKPLSYEVVSSVAIFIAMFCFIFCVLSLALLVTGLDFTTSLSGAATALANVGPGLGEVIGPAGNFTTVPDAAKWILVAGMLVGRLEIMTVLVLFSGSFWCDV